MFRTIWTTATVPADNNDETDGSTRSTGLTLEGGLVIRVMDMLPGKESPMHRTWRPDAVFPLILGTDISGVVAALGDGVTGFAVGDEVYAMVRFPDDLMTGSGAYAEYVSVPAEELALKPTDISHAQAAAAPMSLLTAWQFLIDLGHDAPHLFQSFPHRPVPLAGKTVVVNGAGGGVGQFSVQLAKWQGACVIAIASSKHEALMRDLGADQFIDYKKTAAEDFVRDADLVIDAVGGTTIDRFLQTIKRGGALFLVNPLDFAGHDKAEAMGITLSVTQVRSNGAQLREAGCLLADGTVKAIVDSSFRSPKLPAPMSALRRATSRAKSSSQSPDQETLRICASAADPELSRIEIMLIVTGYMFVDPSDLSRFHAELQGVAVFVRQSRQPFL